MLSCHTVPTCSAQAREFWDAHTRFARGFMQKQTLGMSVARMEMAAPTKEVSKMSGTRSFDQMFMLLKLSNIPPGSSLRRSADFNPQDTL